MNINANTWMGTNDPYARLNKIRSLDPDLHYREIAALFHDDFLSLGLLLACNNFLFTYSAPSMSRILAKTRQSEHALPKRLVDTSLLTGAVLRNGIETEIGRDAARKINAMHRKYDINPKDFIGLGCMEVVSTLGAAEKFGWREVTDVEKECVRRYYSHQVRLFGSSQALPDTLDGIHDFLETYIQDEVRFEPQNHQLSDVLLKFLRTLISPRLRPIMRPVLLSQIDGRIVRACGYDEPGAIAKGVSNIVCKRMGKQDPMPDKSSEGMSQLVQSVYPDGWSIDMLGPENQTRETH